MKTIIDLDTYPRRSHFEFFRNMAYPYVGMTANVDVAHLIRYAKGRGGSPFLAIMWTAAQAANAVPELRQRIVGDEIVQFDHCDTAHTVAMPDKTFCNCRTDCRMPIEDYLVCGAQRQEEAKTHHGFVDQGEDETSLIFASCVPWVAFTQVVQPTPIPADCNPRIVFGKFIKDGESTQMPLHILCNHALVDGRHIGEFFEAFSDIAAQVQL